MPKLEISLDEEKAREENRKRVIDIIKPLAHPGYSCDFGMLKARENISSLLANPDEFELVPDFQRGVVWSQEKQIYFIECMLKNLLPQSVYNLTFNMPFFSNPPVDKVAIKTKYTNLVCVDGLQRFTAVENFVNGKFKAFGDQISVEDLRFTPFDLGRKRFTINIFDYHKTEDILNLYLNMNTSGMAHEDSEIQRVKAMLEAQIEKE